jgi:hypothetical protein
MSVRTSMGEYRAHAPRENVAANIADVPINTNAMKAPRSVIRRAIQVRAPFAADRRHAGRYHVRIFERRIDGHLACNHRGAAVFAWPISRMFRGSHALTLVGMSETPEECAVIGTIERTAATSRSFRQSQPVAYKFGPGCPASVGVSHARTITGAARTTIRARPVAMNPLNTRPPTSPESNACNANPSAATVQKSSAKMSTNRRQSGRFMV